MNNQVLRRQKIDEQYILSDRKLLHTFGYSCLGEGVVEKESWKKKQIKGLLNQYLVEVPQALVTYESVTRGEVILVGRPDSFKAYLRPSETLKNMKCSTKKTVKNINDEVNNYGLSELLDAYHDNFETEEGLFYLEILVNRLNEIARKKQKQQMHSKTYRKGIDKRR